MDVLLNQGNGTFVTAVDYIAGWGASSIAAADVKGDGKPDLAVANTGGSVSVLLNQGNGRSSSGRCTPQRERERSISQGARR